MSKWSRSLALFGVGVVLPAAAMAAIGSGYFSDTVNCSWENPLYYTVSGGPPNTCGELRTYRNGTWLSVPGWLCTDANGNATKGPWSWASIPNDQTDDPAYIRWPGGGETTYDTHIFDKNCPTVSRTSPAGSPPTSWYGTASDTQWGCGFNPVYGYDSWAIYEDLTNNTKWTPGTGSYTSTTQFLVDGNLSGTPGHNVSWSAPFPDVNDHIPGHTYRWRFCVQDCCCSGCHYYEFTY